ncbi:MAG: SURF1 family protein [Gammaproteobacteria bacterium]
MHINIGKWQFHPTLWPTLVTVILLIILVCLGIWQLHRADYKRGLLSQYHQVTTLPPVLLNSTLASGGFDTLPRYRHVQAQGHYDSTHQVLLQDMQHADQVGYEVLTPFVLEPQQRILLVNRGFVAGPDMKTLPDVRVDSDTRSVSGVLGILPVPGIRLGKTIVPAGWPKLILYPRYQTLAELYGSQLLKPVLLLDANQANGFVRDWKPNIGFPPVRHDAYALQWFALALALLIIWIVVNSKRIKHDRDS